jgi:cell wall-associated NlpC family hydrolase
MRMKNKIIFSLITLFFLISSCSSLREHIREQQRASHNEKNFEIESDTETNNNNTGNKSFYEDYSQKLGIQLEGDEDPELIKEAYEWIGTPYLWGGITKGKGVDCSGMVMQIYLTVYNIKLERNALHMMNDVNIINKKDLKTGDLIFFKTMGDNKVSHVALYINDNKFVHASSSRGVMVNDLDESYYAKHYYTCGRVKRK